MDIHNKNQRSYNMSMIKGKNTKPEELVRKYLFANGFRYRKNDKRYVGHPDIVLPKYRTAIFVNGCFWHAHEGCKYFVKPLSNVDFWEEKFRQNVLRDQKQCEKLRDLGWNVIIVWECELKRDNIEQTMKNLIETLNNLLNKRQL